MVHVPLPIQFPPVQRSLPKIFKVQFGDCGGQSTGEVADGERKSRRRESNRRKGESNGRGDEGTGVLEFKKHPYLFSINKFNYLYLMHLKSKLTVLAKNF